MREIGFRDTQYMLSYLLIMLAISADTFRVITFDLAVARLLGITCWAEIDNAIVGIWQGI